MTYDELRTMALEALAIFTSTDDMDMRERYMVFMLHTMYQKGALDANYACKKRNECLLTKPKVSSK